MIVFILAVVGLCFGSFINAYVWRIRQQEKPQKRSKRYSVAQGRSMCPQCKHALAGTDLIPVVSWLLLKGKCRYCKKPISIQYPLVELATAGLFIISYLTWPEGFNTEQWLYLGWWLSAVVSLVALSVYDLKWMLLPNRMLVPLMASAAGLLVSQLIYTQELAPLLTAFWGVLIGGGLFYVLFQLSDGKWIGGGDVKLGAVLGLLVGGPMPAILLLFFASFIGSMITLPLLASGKATRKSKIPFGPFLIVASYLVFLYGERILDWYNRLVFSS